MKNSIKNELFKLCTGEFASILSFWFCYYMWFKEHNIVVIYPLCILSLILLEASIYWFVLLTRIKTNKTFFNSIGKYYLMFKYINLIFIIGYLPVIFSQPATFKYYFGGIFLIIFTIIEYVNYFYVRLSYSNIGILISQIKSNSLRKSKLAKEISTYANR